MKKPTELDFVFYALSDPTRRAVIARLARCGTANVNELAAPFSIGLPAFHKHLGILEAGGLIRSMKDGRVRHCAARHHRLVEAQRWLSQQSHLIKTHLPDAAASGDDERPSAAPERR